MAQPRPWKSYPRQPPKPAPRPLQPPPPPPLPACAEPGCPNPRSGRNPQGLCSYHYRLKREREISDRKRQLRALES